MIAKSLDKFAGVLSILWALGGYALLHFGVTVLPQSFRLAQSPVILSSIIWFGISLLLVIAGFRRGNALGRICSVSTVVFYLWLADPILGFGNLFRRNEYAQVYYGAPECSVRAAIHTDQEAATFLETVRQFAKQHEIRECRQKRYMAYSGPPRPTYKGEHVALWSGVYWTTNASQKTGGVRLAPFDEAYPVKDFKLLADSLASAMRSAFPDRTEVAFQEAEKR
jgi:hypothetical protein